MLRMFVTLSNLLKFSTVVIVAGCLAAATPASAQTDSRWGVLAKLAERDFAYGSEISTWRWKVPNQILEQTSWGFGGSRVTEWELHPLTGDIEQRVFRERRRHLFESATGFRIGADGTLLYGAKVFISAAPGGGYKWGSQLYNPVTPGHNREASVAKIIASGKLRAANLDLIDTIRPPELAQSLSAAPSAAAALSVSTFTPVAVSGGPRLALVIGNSAYAASMGALPNPANDAGAMASALGSLGFQVTLVKNADQKTMRRAISDFGLRLANAGPGSTGLFFYAGHGIQAKGINFLIPTDANIQTQADVEMEAVGADAVLEQMEEARVATNIVILDACRNMPLVRGFRSPSRGLAPMDAPNGSFIAYSTAPGSVAADGLGANSPFVTALVKNLSRRGGSIESIFRDVRREVLTTTEGTQTPGTAHP